MNPRLVKFAVELQNDLKSEKKDNNIYFNNNSLKNFFKFVKAAKVTIPITK